MPALCFYSRKGRTVSELDLKLNESGLPRLASNYVIFGGSQEALAPFGPVARDASVGTRAPVEPSGVLYRAFRCLLRPQQPSLASLGLFR
jgi:hypothetical protein